MTLQVEVPKNTIPLLFKEEVSPVEFYKRQLDIILKNTPNITITKLYLLAYIKVYGQGYKDFVLKDRICTTLDSINNYESELRRMKLLQFYWPDAQINPEIELREESILIFNGIFLDPSKDTVEHKNYGK
jgi:hypothetical protein